MKLSNLFVSAGKEWNTFACPVAAPYMRKTFTAKGGKGTVAVTCSGLYRIFLNGKEYTKGLLAPYLTNPDWELFYDVYEVELREGKNVVAFILGNGLSNSLDYNVWQFENASFRSAPRLAFAVEGEDLLVEAEGVKTHPSHILFDDLHAGEYVDRRREIVDFADVEYDDSSWQEAMTAVAPKGDKNICTIPPIGVEKELKPVSIAKIGKGYVYDFGYVSAGNMHLRLKNATEGQTIEYVHTEVTKDGIPTIDTLAIDRMKTNQKFRYTARGEREENYDPSFTYVGCRYVYVTGIRDDQAQEDLFTFRLMHNLSRETGFFRCSDETANAVEAIVKNSDKCNLYYFPTDCPQREKNGWTGDASVSAEHFLANFDCAETLETWLKLIRKAQNAKGALPGIVPTDSWGYRWGNGPIWDGVLMNLVYEIYRVRGDKKVIYDNADTIMKYFRYTETQLNGEGLADFGLGDWLQPHCSPSGHDAPRKVTNTLSLIDSLQKSIKVFEQIGDTEKIEYCRTYRERLIKNFRKAAFNAKTGVVKGNCQTGQAYVIFVGILSPEEEKKAGEVLLKCIERDDTTLNGGFIGARVLFHALVKIGQIDLAYKLIVQKKFPSYGYMIACGATSLWEEFCEVKICENGDMYCCTKRQPFRQAATFRKGLQHWIENLWITWDDKVLRKKRKVGSLNHHAFGDVSNFFKRYLLGLRVNDDISDVNHVDVKPDFLEGLDFAEGERELSAGKVAVKWVRNERGVELTLEVAEGIFGKIIAPKGYRLEGESEVKTGKYIFYKE